MPNLTASANLPGLSLSSPVATWLLNPCISGGLGLSVCYWLLLFHLYFPAVFLFFFFFIEVGSEFPSSINLYFQLYKIFKRLGKEMPIIGLIVIFLLVLAAVFCVGPDSELSRRIVAVTGPLVCFSSVKNGQGQYLN